MAIIRSFNNQPTVEAKPLPAVAISSSAPAAAFGNTMQTEGDAKALLLAGEQLRKASDATERIVRAMREQAAMRASMKKTPRP